MNVCVVTRMHHYFCWTRLAWPGLAWPGVAWCGLALRGLAWRGLALRSVAWPGVAWPGVAWRGLAWRGVAWHGLVFKDSLRRLQPKACSWSSPGTQGCRERQHVSDIHAKRVEHGTSSGMFLCMHFMMYIPIIVIVQHY